MYTTNTLTCHAHRRCQQRGIPPIVLNWLLDYGAESYQHDGTVIRFFDKRACKRLDSIVGHEATSRMSKFLNAYACTDGSQRVITAGYRYKRVWRKHDAQIHR